MAMIDGDWTVDRATGNIRYGGYDHFGETVVTTGAFVTGDFYQIRVVGDTDFTLIGASANTVGVRFEATGAGGGTTGKATQIASYATVIQFHRWLQALADDEAFAGDDELDIIDKSPSSRSTDNIITLTNGFNIDDASSEHLYDGTIIQGSNLTQERWDGIVNFGGVNSHIQLIQDGAVITDDYWNYGQQSGTHDGAANQAVLTDSTQSWTTDEWIGYTIKNVTDGSMALITANTATTITGVLYGGTENDWDASDVYYLGVPINGDSAQGISHRFMVKTRDLGVDIDRRRLIGTTRRYYNTYGEFKINGTSQGNNVLALNDSTDLNNTTAWATIDALVDITNTEGLRLIDIDNNTTDEEYYSEWTRGANTINVMYEYLKAESMDSSGATLNSLNGEVFRGLTHSYAYNNETGTNFTTNDVGCWGTNVVFTGGSGTAVLGEEVFEDTATPVWKGRVVGIDDNTGSGSIIVDVESGTVTDTETFSTTNGFAGTVSGTPTAQNSAGRCIFYAVDDDGTVGNMYIQIQAGVAPVDGTRIFFGTSSADVARYHDVNGTVTERTISTPFVGASTGSALIGAYGLGVDKDDTSSADTYFDLGNNAITPPNTVQFTVSGFISGDYVLCTEDNGGDINFAQMTLNGLLNGGSVTSVVVNDPLPPDTPTSAGTLGGIRIERNDGLYSLHRYTAINTTTDTFTIPSHSFVANPAADANNVFISYVDVVTSSTSEVFSYVYDIPSGDRTMFLRVRDGGASPIKTAEATGTMGDTGGVASVSRIDDD